MELFETRFPTSPRRADLNATLVSAYAAYGSSDAVIERGRRCSPLCRHAGSTGVALAMADAFARTEQVTEEFAVYDRLLEELAPAPIECRWRRHGAGRNRGGGAARGPVEGLRARARSLHRALVSRSSSRRVAVYRREIERNPNDPGLYAAAAQFLEQNRFTAEVEQIYRLALQQFPDRSWHHRLARWYLRQRRAAAFETLSRDVTRTFDGTDLAGYFSAVVARGQDVNAQCICSSICSRTNGSRII